MELEINIDEPLEALTYFTPLGIRFWDYVKDIQVRDHLIVTAQPANGLTQTVRAIQTGSGDYAFFGLPGLHDVEFSTKEEVLAASPLDRKLFVVKVFDRLQRFLPSVFYADIPLPYEGVFPTGAEILDLISEASEGSPPDDAPSGYYLFPSPSRRLSPGLAAVRADLVERNSGNPAAHAVLEVTIQQRTWYGIADARGCVAVLFPYPSSGRQSPVSPPLSPPRFEPAPQQWAVAIQVRFDADQQDLDGDSKIPEIRSILKQPYGCFWLSEPGSPDSANCVSEWDAELKVGQELILRTDGLPRSQAVLMVDKHITSP
jgi:hypothetical protein